jgi:myo-inositol-1-phosphate synthase
MRYCFRDVDSRKVHRPVKEAIYAKPNCCYRIVDSISCNANVYKGPVLDGIANTYEKLCFGESHICCR